MRGLLFIHRGAEKIRLDGKIADQPADFAETQLIQQPGSDVSIR
jgi:hypothetical protein